MTRRKRSTTPKKIRIFFEDYHHDGADKVVEATEEEWQALIAPAVTNRHPIDGSTVDSDIFDKLYARRAKNVTLAEVKKIDRVVPIV